MITKKYTRLFFTLSFILIGFTLRAQEEVRTKTSFIVHLEKGKKMDASQRFASLPGNTYTCRQICDEPLNLWLIETAETGRSARSFYKDLDPETHVITLSENRPLTLRKSPSDSLYNRQWQYKNTGSNGGKPGADINAEPAWNITTGGLTPNGDTIVVAVVDDGLDIEHEDIAPNLWTNHMEIEGDSIDNDNNGYIDDIHGWNVGKNSGEITSGGSHGTPVAGIIGARGDNRRGVAGVNWEVKLMPIKYGSANEANALAAYAYAYKMRKLYNETQGAKGAFVVATNSSWGIDRGQADEATLWCAMYDSLGTVGILSMGATANVNLNVDVEGDLPTGCASDFLIAVTNLDKNDNKVNAAGFGRKSVDIGAYGSEAYTVATNNRYSGFGGTSGATPHVAGAVALMYSVPCADLANLLKSDPRAAALYVRDIVLNTTTENASLQDITTSSGKLNLGKAAETLLSRCGSCQVPVVIEDHIIDYTNVAFSWLSSGGEAQLRYRKEGADDWITLPAASQNEVLVENLDRCTGYEYQLGYQCSGSTLAWSSLRFFSTEGCCYAPADVEVAAIDSAFIFTAGVQKMLQIEIRKKGSNQWDTLQFENTIRYSNLEECSQYEARYTAYCQQFDVYSPASGTVFLAAPCGNCTAQSYCSPAVLQNDSEWIESIGVGDETYASGQDTKGYGNHLGAFIPGLHRADSVVFTFTPGFSAAGYSEYFTAYIDWNQDGDFSEEERFTQSRKADKNAFTDTILVPVDAALGFTRMRITMAYREASMACDSPAEFGEAEDYCVEILEVVSTHNETETPLVLYPNPAQNSFTISGSNLAMYNQLSIIDAGGKNVLQQSLSRGIQHHWQELSGKLNAGYYVVKLSGTNVSPSYLPLVIW